MKRILMFVVLAGLLAATIYIYAAGIGGTYTYQAQFFVYDQDGNPLSGIDVRLLGDHPIRRPL